MQLGGTKAKEAFIAILTIYIASAVHSDMKQCSSMNLVLHNNKRKMKLLALLFVKSAMQLKLN